MKNNEKYQAKIRKKELKKLEKKEKKEIEEAYMHDRLIDKKIKKEISDIKREEYIKKMTPIWEERKRINEAPHLSLLEEIGNSISHGLGVIFTLVAFILMIIKCDEPAKFVATFVYSFSMLLMFLNSCLYHAFRWGSTVKRIWRRFDYTSIYFLICGTFAPIQLIELPYLYGNNGYIIGIIYFCVMWAIAITGITLTCVFGPGRMKKINFPIYFILGWTGIIFLPIWLIHQRYGILFWILIGGIVYTLGMIPFALLRKKNVSHFIWHIIVFLGVITQFIGILLYLY